MFEPLGNTHMPSVRSRTGPLRNPRPLSSPGHTFCQSGKTGLMKLARGRSIFTALRFKPVNARPDAIGSAQPPPSFQCVPLTAILHIISIFSWCRQVAPFAHFASAALKPACGRDVTAWTPQQKTDGQISPADQPEAPEQFGRSSCIGLMN